MSRIALEMLTGDRCKDLAIIVGVTFASLLIAEQAAIVCSMMRRTMGQIFYDCCTMIASLRFF